MLHRAVHIVPAASQTHRSLRLLITYGGLDFAWHHVVTEPRLIAHLWCRADKEFVYTVALQKRIVQVSEHILAPEYQPGDKAGLRSDGGTIEPVYVLATNAQQWCDLAEVL